MFYASNLTDGEILCLEKLALTRCKEIAYGSANCETFPKGFAKFRDRKLLVTAVNCRDEITIDCKCYSKEAIILRFSLFPK